MSQPEAWLRGPIEGIAPVLQPVAHALIQAQEDVASLAPALSSAKVWRESGAATAGFHLLHMVGALDRLFTYARGEALNDAQKAVAKAESVPHPELTGEALSALVEAAVSRALTQLRGTPADSLLEHRGIGRAGLPSTVLGCLFHAAEHTSRHAGQFITTVKLASQ